jgi:hypothetical protein
MKFNFLYVSEKKSRQGIVFFRPLNPIIQNKNELII